MKSILLSLILTIFSLVFSINTFAKTITLHCPEMIETTASLKKPTPGWLTYTDQQKKQSLDYIAFYFGHPKNLASLAPTSNTESIRFKLSVFTFKAEDEIWFSCHYNNTQLQLIKKLPSIKHCIVKYEQVLNPPADKITSITCET